jgi:hypothetical protein
MNELLDQVNLDELYERRREIQEQKESIYKLVLSRVITKIKNTSRLKHEDQFCFYVVPDVMIGFPRYDVKACIQYIVEKLEENKLFVKYTHPNMLFISWQHYIPAYERKDIKKRTGVQIDGFGNVLNEDVNVGEFDDITKKNTQANKQKPDYKKTSSYTPLGIYNEDMVRKINEKIR